MARMVSKLVLSPVERLDREEHKRPVEMDQLVQALSELVAHVLLTTLVVAVEVGMVEDVVPTQPVGVVVQATFLLKIPIDQMDILPMRNIILLRQK